jgi:hypothetical protein
MKKNIFSIEKPKPELIDIQLSELSTLFKPMIDNMKLLDFFKLIYQDGSEKD